MFRARGSLSRPPLCGATGGWLRAFWKPPLPTSAAWPRVLSQHVLLPPGLRGPRSWGRWGLGGHGAQRGDPTACVVLSVPETAALLTDAGQLMPFPLGRAWPVGGVREPGLSRCLRCRAAQSLSSTNSGREAGPQDPPALGLYAVFPGLPVARPAGRCSSLGQGLESVSRLSCPSLGPHSPVCPPRPHLLVGLNLPLHTGGQRRVVGIKDPYRV